MNKALEESMKKLQAEAQSLLLNSGYHRSLQRFHTSQADDFDAQVDVIAKKIRNLEANRPKENEEEKVNVDHQESPGSSVGDGSLGVAEV